MLNAIDEFENVSTGLSNYCFLFYKDSHGSADLLSDIDEPDSPPYYFSGIEEKEHEKLYKDIRAYCFKGKRPEDSKGKSYMDISEEKTHQA
jgi:hypothetical protein